MFAGATGDPDQPKRLTWHVAGTGGKIVMAEIDRQRPGWRVALGGWRHTAPLPSADGVSTVSGATGLFVVSEHLLAGRAADDSGGDPNAFRLDGWVRYGRTFTASATIGSYLGGGLVAHNPWPGMPDDSFGLAIARALIPHGIDPALAAETVIEASWQHQFTPHLLVQPDLQWIHQPGGDNTRHNCVLIGLRLIVLH